MPYIDQDKRIKLEPCINVLVNTTEIIADDEEIEGVMNYIITEVGNRCMRRPEWRYKWINRFIGVLECVKLEFYRRLVRPYENKAISKNGDVSAYKDAIFDPINPKSTSEP